MTPTLLRPLIYLMGPTASGKTPLAVELVQHFPCDIISVDSAMVYRGMDIGTAKPTKDILSIAPHHLINMNDPSEAYSAGQFRIDALQKIDSITARGRVPLLVGGSMLYFRVLQQGLAHLPHADVHLRSELQARANQEGLEALHAQLMQCDPDAAKRIPVQDGQRIQRALEVFLLTGKPISAWQAEGTQALQGYKIYPLALTLNDRSDLHKRIALRFQHMLATGFIDEVQQLYARGDLAPHLPSMRTVGYRQAIAYFAGHLSYTDMCDQAIAATRQLAKRQLTWLRTWPQLTWLETGQHDSYQKAKTWMKKILSMS